jgi:sulfur carrier protein ThiS
VGVAYVAAAATWTLIGPTPFVSASVTPDRAAPAARGRAVPPAPTSVTVTVDGLAGTVRTTGTVAEALRSLGLSTSAADLVSAPVDDQVVAGQRIAVDRGLPVTLVDGGREVASRSARGTVAELLASAGVVLGPLDRVDQALDSDLRPGTVVRVVRIAELQVTVLEDVPFPVQFRADANLDRGNQLVLVPGQAGAAINTYRLRVIDGREMERRLLDSNELAAPVAELRAIGTRVPRAASEIETIIREAAAAQGADPDQLLRVAWCESRYNPSAYNPSGASGLFQFMPRTWAVNSARAGFAGASVWDPVAAANVAAYMFAMGQAGQWVCR